MNWMQDPAHKWIAAYRVSVLLLLTLAIFGHHIFGVSLAPGCLPTIEDALGSPIS